MELEKIILDIQKKHFPELEGLDICLKPKGHMSHAMEVSAFFPKIFFDESWVNKFDKVEIKATVVHELCHLVQFRKMSLFQKVVLYIKVEFLKDLKCLSHLEKEADRMVIGKGYGRQIAKARRRAWKIASKESLKRRRQIYYSPEELEKLIKQMK